jgi:hypothetical protein
MKSNKCNSLVLFVFLLASCQGVQQKMSENKVDSTTIVNHTNDSINNKLRADSLNNKNAIKNATVSCDSLLTLLIKSSNIENIKGLSSKANGFNKGVLSIKIYYFNPEVSQEMTYETLLLNIREKQLIEFKDNGSRIFLKYDTTIFNRLISNCNFYEKNNDDQGTYGTLDSDFNAK